VSCWASVPEAAYFSVCSLSGVFEGGGAGVSALAGLNRVLKHVYSEPKFVAQVEWWHLHPDPIQQALAIVGRDAAEQYIEGHGWPEGVAEMEISVTMPPEEPDWDWWEPRHDQPWRREQARDREAGFS
jgi:hypothetical protein